MTDPSRNPYANRVFARGFLLSTATTATVVRLTSESPYLANLRHWQQTFFGPCVLWVDTRLNYSAVRDDRHGVGLLGLCVDPFQGLNDNQSIAAELYNALRSSRAAFLDRLDQLTGAFVVLYRDGADVRVVTDAAATKPVYCHTSADGTVSVSGHASILAQLHGLPEDPRARRVWTSESYRKDPSRYLPGTILPFQNLMSLPGNHEFDLSQRRLNRIFPRAPLPQRPFDDSLVDEVCTLMLRQAELIGRLGRPLWLAATGGRDSRVSAATFSGQPGLRYFSFHMPRINHLTMDVKIARQLSEIEGVPLSVFDLESYHDAKFRDAFQAHSPMGIWPAAALCYVHEFEPDAIHIRSTVSEIGRIFYGKRSVREVNAEVLAQTYTNTDFCRDAMVVEAMHEFIEATEFFTDRFFGYDPYDMFYWEHRNSKWQNVLCAEAEMATDVFIPFNNRRLLQLLMSVPLRNRAQADVHRAVWQKTRPEFDAVEIDS